MRQMKFQKLLFIVRGELLAVNCKTVCYEQ